MAKAPQRTQIQGPAFIRLLASLASAPLAATSPPLSERLSEWLDWTRAVALSRTLDGRLPVIAVDAPFFANSDEDECVRIHAALAEAIQAIVDYLPVPPQSAESVLDDGLSTPIEYTSFRERYRDLQQSMQAEVGRLRGHLRDMLASASPEMARLAEVDAVMEMTLTPREHALLGAVPALLGQHFNRLRDAAMDSQNQRLSSTEPPGQAPWLAPFRQDMRNVLLAELDVRFQPVEGLLSALRNQ